MNIIIAIVLFLMTSLTGYILWYIVRGHSKRETVNESKNGQDKGKTNKKEPGTDNNGKISKDAYCYPKINDVMGYEFVTVVNIPPELTQDKPKTTQKVEDWSSSSGIGLQAVSGQEGINDDGNEAPMISDDDSRYGKNSRPEKVFENVRTKTDEQENEYEVVEESEISSEEIQMLDNMNTDWVNREYDDPNVEDDYLNAIIDNNPEMFEQPVNDEETNRISLETKALQKMQAFEESLANNSGDIGMDILEQLGEMDNFDEGPDTGQDGTIDEDDIPEI